MKVRDYLISQNAVTLAYVASQMWPGNKSAKVYLSKKLNGALPWTQADEESALEILRKLGEELRGL